MINIIKGKDAIWHTDKYDVVLVGTSINNMLTNGFQCKMRLKYPYIEEPNNSTPYSDLRKLGKRLTIQGKPIISLLYICRASMKNRESLDYNALEKCLIAANAEFRGKRIITTILGSSRFDGNGDRSRILEIMEKTLTSVDVDVYDYEQLHKRDEISIYRKKLREIRHTDLKKYKEFGNITQFLKKMYLEDNQTNLYGKIEGKKLKLRGE